MSDREENGQVRVTDLTPHEKALAYVETAERALEALTTFAADRKWHGVAHNARDLWIDLQEVRNDIEGGAQ